MIVTTLLYNGSAQKLTVSVNELEENNPKTVLLCRVPLPTQHDSNPIKPTAYNYAG